MHVALFEKFERWSTSRRPDREHEAGDFFGTVVQNKRVVYRSPRTQYERFVNRFVEKAPSKTPVEEAVKSANREWPSYRDSESKLSAFLSAPRDEPGSHVLRDFGFTRSSSSSGQSASSAGEETPKQTTRTLDLSMHHSY